MIQISKTEFRGWQDAYRVTVGAAEMIVLAEVGPRVISLRLNDGPNLLYVDEDTAGGGQGDDEWHIYGGHRIWQSPETEDAVNPDNLPCETRVESDRLILTTPVDPDTKLRKRLLIGTQGDLPGDNDAQGGRFLVESQLINTSSLLNHGAVWALTCVVPQGVIAFPWGTGGDWDVKHLNWWAKWTGHSSQIGSDQYQPSDDLFLIRPTGEEGKVGTYSPEGWVALCRDDATFIKSFTPHPYGTYPDGGCSVEVYTSEAFIEMETLSPTTVIHPGAVITQRETWTVTKESVDPADGAALRRLLALSPLS